MVNSLGYRFGDMSNLYEKYACPQVTGKELRFQERDDIISKYQARSGAQILVGPRGPRTEAAPTARLARNLPSSTPCPSSLATALVPPEPRLVSPVPGTSRFT